MMGTVRWKGTTIHIIMINGNYDYGNFIMIKTTSVPIVKNKCGNISESNNYRPIALATIISKLFESVLRFKCEDYLSTCLNQFGFK